MKVFIDIFTNDELISDSYKPSAPFDDESCSNIAFEVQSRRVAKGCEDYGISANADADAPEGVVGETDSDVVQVIDVVDKFNLQEQYMDKEGFVAYIKRYMKHVCEFLDKNNPDRLNEFKKGASVLVKQIISNFDDCSIFIGENASNAFAEFKAHPIVARYAGEDPNPRFIFFIDGLRSEKC